MRHIQTTLADCLAEIATITREAVKELPSGIASIAYHGAAICSTTFLPPKAQTAFFGWVHEKAGWLEHRRGLEAALYFSDESGKFQSGLGCSVLFISGLSLAVPDMYNMHNGAYNLVAALGVAAVSVLVITDGIFRSSAANGEFLGPDGKAAYTPTCFGGGIKALITRLNA